MQPQECASCFARDECFTLHRALEVGIFLDERTRGIIRNVHVALTPARGISSAVASSHRFGIKTSKARDPLVIGRTRQSSRWFRDRRAQIASRSDGGSPNGDGRHYYYLRALPRVTSGLNVATLTVVLSRDGGDDICRAQSCPSPRERTVSARSCPPSDLCDWTTRDKLKRYPFG